jgi:hypothetical protein
MMNKEKQIIEEMAYDICVDRKANFADGCRVCSHHENRCLYQDIACSLYNKGYRKQSENMVEVVRCKDCKHYCLSDFRKPNEPRWCELSRDGEEYPKPNDFCSRGAKMKGGAE